MTTYWKNTSGEYIKDAGAYVKCASCPCGGGGEACGCCASTADSWLVTFPATGFTQVAAPFDCDEDTTFCDDLNGAQFTLVRDYIPISIPGGVESPSPLAGCAESPTGDDYPCTFGYDALWNCRGLGIGDPDHDARIQIILGFKDLGGGTCRACLTLILGDYEPGIGSTDHATHWKTDYGVGDFDCEGENEIDWFQNNDNGRECETPTSGSVFIEPV